MAKDDAARLTDTFERADTVLLRPARLAEEDDDMDITPMIDVTFLLLIFFMLAARMDPSREIKLPVAEFAASVSSRDAIVLTLAETDSDRVDIYLNTGKSQESLLTVSAPEAQEAAITDYIRKTKLERPEVTKVIIQAERKIAHREVNRVARIAQAAGEMPMYVAVMEES